MIETVKLGDVAIVKGGKRLPKGTNLITTPNSHPYIRVRDLNNQSTLELNDDFEYVDDETQKSISRYIVEAGDIVLSIVGTIGLVAIIGESLHKANLTENCVKLTQLDGVDRDYLYYFLKSGLGQAEIAKGTVGAVQAKLPIKNIQNIDVILPDIETQKRISSILRSIDEKISTNQKINDNLQQQAAALFESWFVNHDPWDGVQPSEWINAPLGSFVEIKRGGSPRPIQDYLSNSGLRWLKISDVTSLNSPFVLEIKEHIKEEGLRKTVFLHAGELVLSNSATPGIPKILDVDTCIHDGWLAISDFEDYFIPDFLYHLLSSNHYQQIMRQKASFGGAVQNLNADIVRALELPVLDISKQKSIVSILDRLDALCGNLASGLSTEIEERQQQYEYYRDKLLSFKKKE